MRQYTVNYSERALFVAHSGQQSRAHEDVSTASLARFWRAINRQHDHFAMVGCDDRRGVYRYVEIVVQTVPPAQHYRTKKLMQAIRILEDRNIPAGLVGVATAILTVPLAVISLFDGGAGVDS